MTTRFSAKFVPVLAGMFSTWMLAGCGGLPDEQVGQVAQPVVETVVTKAGQINQHDLDGFLSSVKLVNCKFSVAGGTATFTPSNELAQVIYGDPHGDAHKLTFMVPPISTPSVSITITSLDAEMANTGVTLSGSNANVHVGFHGMLHVKLSVSGINVEPDIQIKSSSLAFNMTYDSMSERAKCASVTSKFDIKTSKCGLLGWCNGIVDSLLKTNLPTLVEGPLRDALTKGLDSASATADLDSLLMGAYNIKDPQPTAWSMAAHSLTQSGGAFNFTAQRTTP